MVPNLQPSRQATPGDGGCMPRANAQTAVAANLDPVIGQEEVEDRFNVPPLIPDEESSNRGAPVAVSG